MLRSSKYFQLIIKKRIVIFALIASAFFILALVVSVIIGNSTNTVIYNLFYLMSSVIINIVAAALWVSISSIDQYIEKSEPILRALPFLADRQEKIYIIFASVPSRSGQMVTGMGEALAVGILLETIKQMEFPMDMVEVNYESNYSNDRMHEILSSENVILLGGPNFNKFTHHVFEDFQDRLPYVFLKDLRNNSEISQDPNTKIIKKYSGLIVKNVIASPTIAYPEPLGVTSDALVEKDCGIIIRLLNTSKKRITVLAGGMTAGVWLSTKMITEQENINKWYPQLKSKEALNEYSIVLESRLNHILSADNYQLKVIAISKLIN